MPAPLTPSLRPRSPVPRSLCLVAVMLTVAAAAASAAEPVSLFDGKTFAGWNGDTAKTWRIEEGAIVAGSPEKAAPRNEFLATDREFENFEITLEYRMDCTAGCNAGVQFRSKRVPNHHEVSGYQADIAPGITGALYDESRRNRMLGVPPKELQAKALAASKDGWVAYSIRAEGRRIRLSINGIETLDYTEPDETIPRKGVIALQIHGGLKGTIRYRSIKITELPATPAASLEPSTLRFGDADAVRAGPLPPLDGRRFAIAPGETICWLGQTDAVRMSREGTFESLLAVHAAEARPRLRSMAWEGDTVYSQSRDRGFGDWKSNLLAAGGTLVIASFGQAEIVEQADASRPPGVPDALAQLPAFIAAYEKLLDQFATVTRRLVIVSPHPFERPASPQMPDRTPLNPVVAAYARAIGELSDRRGAVFVDLSTLSATGGRLTDNGVHLSQSGQKAAAVAMAAALGIPMTDESTLAAMRSAVAEKNRLWFDVWRPMNWFFAFGGGTGIQFGKPFADHPPLKDELAAFKPLVAAADAHARDVALAISAGRPLPPPPAPASRPAASPSPPTDAVDHSPEAERAAFTVLDGYEVNLYASEADGLVKPLQIRFDERGRLWALCSPTYPQIEPGRKPGDYVLVCDDTDGDGRADTFQKFAEGLFMPQGIAFGDGGVYLCEATELLHLRDTDGDGRADDRRVILSGFGTHDSHHAINAVEIGPAGELLFCQGHNAYSFVETPWGSESLRRAGVWRYRPKTGRLFGFFNESSAGLNAQGVTSDDFGQIIHNSGAKSGGFHTSPGMVPTMRPRTLWAMVSPDRRSSGVEVIGTAHLPDELQGCLVWGGFMANNVQVHRVKDEGAGLVAEVMPDLFRSSRREFRPVGVRVGGDGAIYVCDWYNPAIGHYQFSYRDPVRDHSRGRIWRVTAKGRPLVPRERLDGLSPTDLVERLRSPERLVRQSVKQRLFDLPTTDAVRAVDAFAASIAADDPLRPRLLVDAAGICQAHEVWRPDMVRTLAASGDPRARAYAARVVGHRAESLPAMANPEAVAGGIDECLDLLRTLAVDEHPRVRMETVVAAGWVRDPRAVEVAAAAATTSTTGDRTLDYAFAQAVDAIKPFWQEAMAAGRLRFDGDIGRIKAVLAADGTAAAAPVLRAVAAESGMAAEPRTELLALLAGVGDGSDLRRTATEAVAAVLPASGSPPQLSAAQAVRVLDAVVTSAATRGIVPPGDPSDIVLPLFDAADVSAVRAGAVLTGLWRVKAAATRLESILADRGRRPVAITTAAIESLARVRGASAVASIEPFASEMHPEPVRLAAIRGLLAGDVARAATAALAVATAAGDDEKRIAAAIAPVVSTKGGAAALDGAIGRASVSADTAKLLLRVLAGAGVGDAAVTSRLQAIAGISVARPDYDPAFVKALADEALASGDPVRGRAVYLSKTANCTACHRLGGDGGVIGPELTIVGQGRSPEVLVESVLWPNRQVREGYAVRKILTDDGRMIVGYVRNETAEKLDVLDVTANRMVAIPRSSIEEMLEGGSPMPEGLTAGMTRGEVRDLVRYLVDLKPK